MANKQHKYLEVLYKEEYKKRSRIRMQARTKKYISRCAKKEAFRESGACPYCGEVEYCYCGSRTPGIIDY